MPLEKAHSVVADCLAIAFQQPAIKNDAMLGGHTMPTSELIQTNRVKERSINKSIAKTRKALKKIRATRARIGKVTWQRAHSASTGMCAKYVSARVSLALISHHMECVNVFFG